MVFIIYCDTPKKALNMKIMNPTLHKAFSLALLCLFLQSNLAWADGPPKQKDTVKCTKHSDVIEEKAINSLREKMQKQLKDYNDARFQMADVLNAMVSDYSLQGYSKKRILGYAKHLKDISEKIPNLDPDTADYKNFDFQLGISFASTVIFLNTTDDVLKHFKAEQDNPESNISKFVENMTKEEVAYKALLKELQEKDAASCV